MKYILRKRRVMPGKENMSVNMLMYRAHQLSQDELDEIRNKDLYDVNELDGYELRTYSFEEMSTNPARFEQIKDYLQTVELMHTTTDYKACAIAHGMPAKTSCYSYTMLSYKVVFLFNDCELDVARDALDEFTKTEEKTYYVVKRKCIDVDIDSWVAQTLMKALEECNDGDTTDISYVPIHFNAQTCNKLCKILVDLYDKEELYPNAELAKFMLELMRVMCHEDDVFIEFQD